MNDRVEIGGLGVARCLHDLIEDEIAPCTGVDPEAFWRSLADIMRDLGPKNRALRPAGRAAGADRRVARGTRGASHRSRRVSSLP